MDSKELADKHYQEHRSSSWVPEEKMGQKIQSGDSLHGPKMGSVAVANALGTGSTSGSVETRVVDPLTGGEKGSKLARYDLIPVEFEEALANHYGKGAQKYEDRNWERGYKWSLSVAALRRHLAAWLRGEDNDPETGSNHLIAVAWHAVALFIFQLRGLGTDDIRPRK